jgi:hypothetical protein
MLVTTRADFISLSPHLILPFVVTSRGVDDGTSILCTALFRAYQVSLLAISVADHKSSIRVAQYILLDHPGAAIIASELKRCSGTLLGQIMFWCSSRDAEVDPYVDLEVRRRCRASPTFFAIRSVSWMYERGLGLASVHKVRSSRRWSRPGPGVSRPLRKDPDTTRRAVLAAPPYR